MPNSTGITEPALQHWGAGLQSAFKTMVPVSVPSKIVSGGIVHAELRMELHQIVITAGPDSVVFRPKISGDTMESRHMGFTRWIHEAHALHWKFVHWCHHRAPWKILAGCFQRVQLHRWFLFTTRIPSQSNYRSLLPVFRRGWKIRLTALKMLANCNLQQYWSMSIMIAAGIKEFHRFRLCTQKGKPSSFSHANST